MTFSHLDDAQRVRMVDIGEKPVQVRRAVAEGFIQLSAHTMEMISRDAIAKGSVLTAAHIAGIQAAKRTDELIPLCHPLPLDHVAIAFEPREDGIRTCTTVRSTGRTGAEMEALCATAAALLTIYDMCKAVDKAMVIHDIRLISKTKHDPAEHTP